MISILAWVIAIAAWLVILLSGPALVALVTVPRLRRWWLRPLLRRVTGRSPGEVAARTVELELELELTGEDRPGCPGYGWGRNN